MSYGLFDIIGPIMHGPSSNHTAGAGRIGYLARGIMGGCPKDITYLFHPHLLTVFSGHRTHIALTAGMLGYREYDDAFNGSLTLAREQGVTLSYASAGDHVDRNTMRIEGEVNGVSWSINGISVGAGNIVVDRINGVPVWLDANGHLYTYITRAGADLSGAVALAEGLGTLRVFAGEGLFLIESRDELSGSDLAAIEGALGGAVVFRSFTPSLYPFAEKDGAPLFTSFEGLVEEAGRTDLLDAVLRYEEKRSRRSRADIEAEMLRIVRIIARSMARGLEGNNPLVGGFCSGSDGKMMADHAGDSGSLLGYTYNMAVARALAMSEVSGSAGIVAAVPTAGSAGAVPGALFQAAERYSKTEADLAHAFLIAAAVGAIIGNTAVFSGSVGGCQAEIGIGAAMGAGACVWLAGGSAEAAVHAAALALKNLLGLTCDCPAPPVEVPCIKRNAMGVSAAYMGCEMALAGVRSVIPPDDVVIALADVQKRLPAELKSAEAGGLGAAPYAKVLQRRWRERLEILSAQI